MGTGIALLGRVGLALLGWLQREPAPLWERDLFHPYPQTWARHLQAQRSTVNANTWSER